MLVFLFEDFFENIQFKNCSSFNIFFSFSRRTKLCVKQSGNYSNLKLKCMKYFHLRVNPVSRTRAVQLLHWILNLSICFALRFHAFMYLEKIWSRLLPRIHAKDSYISNSNSKMFPCLFPRFITNNAESYSHVLHKVRLLVWRLGYSAAAATVAEQIEK